MDALEFLKEARRMCLAIGSCDDCQLGYGCVVDDVKKVPDRVLETNCLVVEQWSKEHPVQTNAQKFEEVFGWPQADIDSLRYARAWWDEPYKEPGGRNEG